MDRLWDILLQNKIIEIKDHEYPITSIEFVDYFSTLVSASKGELKIWSITVEENEDYKANIDDDESENKENEPESRFVVQAK